MRSPQIRKACFEPAPAIHVRIVLNVTLHLQQLTIDNDRRMAIRGKHQVRRGYTAGGKVAADELNGDEPCRARVRSMHPSHVPAFARFNEKIKTERSSEILGGRRRMQSEAIVQDFHDL